jgi:hypothetical protein
LEGGVMLVRLFDEPVLFVLFPLESAPFIIAATATLDDEVRLAYDVARRLADVDTDALILAWVERVLDDLGEAA